MEVNSGNRISYSPHGILVEHFILSNNTQKIAIESTTAALNSPAIVHIENFDIRDITSIINSDTLFASGIINGEFTVSEWDKKIARLYRSFGSSTFFFKNTASRHNNFYSG